MNRKERIRMLSRVLLMPFASLHFLAEDPLEKRAKCCLSGEGYEKSSKNLIQVFRVFSNCDRLDELAQAVRMFYPEEALAEQFQKTNSLNSYYIDMILRIAGEFVTLRDGRVSIRMWTDPRKDTLFEGQSGLYKVELWSEFCRTITPDLFISGYFVQSGISNVENLYHLPDNIYLSDALVDRYLKKGIAETHLHFSAAVSYLPCWEYSSSLIAQVKPRPQDQRLAGNPQLQTASLLRLMLAHFLVKEDGRNVQAFYKDTYYERRLLSDLSSQKYSFFPLAPEEQGDLNRHIWNYYLDGEWPYSTDILNCGAYRGFAKLNTSAELLLLFQALWYARKNPRDQLFQSAFLYYLRLKHYCFSRILQPVGISGLTEFRGYFANGSRILKGRRDELNHVIAFDEAFRHHCKSPYLKKLEIRISPPSVPQKRPKNDFQWKTAIALQLQEIFHAFLTIYDEFRGESPEFPSFGIIYHFIKRDITHPTSNVCYFTLKEELENGGRNDNYVEAIRAQGDQFLRCLRELLQEIPYLSEYVVGLDSAGEENDAEPWCFAPVYRDARSRRTTQPIELSTRKHMQNMGFTYHVGEDYRHVLSGLRHIDEVLTYFGYQAGDRLGHGLALQIDLQKWLENNEVVSIPAMENLENLLWLWNLCGETSVSLKVHELKLEQEIMKQAERIYENNIQGLSPYMLWEAYKRKFERLDQAIPPHKTQSRIERNFSLRDCVRENGFFCQKTDRSGWNVEKLLLTHHCPAFVERHYQKPMLLHSPMELLPLYQEVQKVIREKVENAGIFVETNPTSNMIIGDVDGLYNYPVTTLNGKPMEEGPSLLLSVNSDDPLIFTTNAENEISILYHMLMGRGYSSEDVLSWIDKVRAYGMNSSFIRTVKEPNQQKKELEYMIRKLSNRTRAFLEEEAYNARVF